MSNTYIYKAINPEVQRAQYGPLDEVDFKMNFSGQALVPNNVYLSGNIMVLYDGTNKMNDDNKQIYMDCDVGMHSVIDTVVSTTANQGNIENIQNYARYVKMMVNGTVNENDKFNSEHLIELKSPSNAALKTILCGQKVKDSGDAVVADNNTDFMLKLDCVLNNIMSGPVSYQKTGEITVSLRLADVNRVLFGSDVQPTTTYVLENLQLHYQCVPDSAEYQKTPVQSKVKASIVNSITNSYSVVNITAPIVSDSLVLSFINASNEESLVNNSLQLQPLPLVDVLEWVFNDTTNNLVSYQLTNQPEMIKYTEDAYKSINNMFSMSRLINAESYTLGVLFGYSQMANSKLSVQIQSAVNTEYRVYAYLNGLIEF